jgi:hypothetical protein
MLCKFVITGKSQHNSMSRTYKLGDISHSILPAIGSDSRRLHLQQKYAVQVIL